MNIYLLVHILTFITALMEREVADHPAITGEIAQKSAHGWKCLEFIR